ncbi:MAG: TolC family protein [candidate division Zixibacteria bacterium]
MWRIIIFVTFLSFLAMPITVPGQPIPGDPVLDSLISSALNNNPDIQAVMERVESAKYMISPAGALPDPMASIGLSGPLAESWVGEPMATPNVKLSLSQKFPFPGKLGASKNAAKNRARGLAESLEAARQRLAAMVRAAYYDLAYWLDAKETVERNIDFVSELEVVARERYKVGQGLQVHVLQAQKSLTRLQDQELMIDQMIETSRWRLAKLLGNMNPGSLTASLPDVENLPEQDDESLKDRLVKRNPDYKSSAFTIEMRKDILRKAKLGYLPDITVGAGYGFRRENDMFPMFSRDMLTVTAGLNIPLWAGWKQKNIISSAKANLRQSEYSRSDLRNRLTFELEKYLLEYRRNRSKYTLYGQSLIPQTQATLESARAAYQVGKLEFLDVIIAQMELFNAELELQRSLADALKALAEIDRLTADAVAESNN